jgi:hypothetical protein
MRASGRRSPGLRGAALFGLERARQKELRHAAGALETRPALDLGLRVGRAAVAEAEVGLAVGQAVPHQVQGAPASACQHQCADTTGRHAVHADAVELQARAPLRVRRQCIQHLQQLARARAPGRLTGLRAVTEVVAGMQRLGDDKAGTRRRCRQPVVGEVAAAAAVRHQHQPPQAGHRLAVQRDPEREVALLQRRRRCRTGVDERDGQAAHAEPRQTNRLRRQSRAEGSESAAHQGHDQRPPQRGTTAGAGWRSRRSGQRMRAGHAAAGRPRMRAGRQGLSA